MSLVAFPTLVTDPTYGVLSSFSVLAAAGITSATGSVTVNGGFWGSAVVPTATMIGTQSLNTTIAQTELTALVNQISALTPSPQIGSAPPPISPGVYSGGDPGFAGALTFDAGGNPDAQFFIISSSTITFKNVPSMTLTGGAQACNIFFVAGTAINFEGTVPSVINGIFIGASGVTFSNSPTDGFFGAIYAQTGTGDITFNGSGSPVVNGCVVCYAEGTKILTKRGYVAVEDLTKDDKIATKGTIGRSRAIYGKADYKPLVWLGSFTVNAQSTDTTPVCIKAGALGENRPFEDLYVSPNHTIGSTGKMVHAKDMINGTTIVQEYPHKSVTYYHVELPAHSAIVANGVLAESYLDCNNRKRFHKSTTFRKATLEPVMSRVLRR